MTTAAASWTDRLHRHALALPVLLLAFAAHMTRFGYGFGDGDHDELIPSAMALLDPRLFGRDWLVQYVIDTVNVRTAFVWLVATAGRVAPLPVAVAALHGMVFLAAGAGLYALGVTLTRSRTAAALGTALALAVTPAFTLGGNAVVAPMLVPEGVAWALVLPAVALALRRRVVLAGVLLGVAAWVHLLTGLLPALALGAVALWRAAERAPGAPLGHALRLGAVFAVTALPVLLPVGLGQVGATAAGGGPSPFYIHAVFRNPFHHLLSAFPAGQHVRFWGLLALGAAGLWAMRRWGAAQYAPEVVRLWIVTLVAGALAAVFVEVVPVELVAKLQLFKLTVLANVLATLTAAGGAVAFARAHGTGRLTPGRLRWGRAALWLSGGVAALALIGAAAGTGPLASRVAPRQHAATPLAAVETWARERTPQGALFAVPPSVGTFRTGAQRALIANWHAFVFDDAAMGEWYARLYAVAPIAAPSPTADRKPLLDAAYAARTAPQWRRIGARYGVDYVVERRGAPPLPFPVAYRNEAWAVYALGAAVP